MAVLDPFGLVDFRDIVEQLERVRFGRVVEHFSGSTLVHDLTVVHDEDTVRNVVCKTDIVSHEHHRHLQLVFQLAEVIEDVCAHTGVHHGGSFVSDQHLRTEREDTGQKHTLHLTAGKFERVLAFDIFGLHVHGHQAFVHAAADFFLGGLVLEDVQGVFQLATDSKELIEASERILEHGLHFVPVSLQVLDGLVAIQELAASRLVKTEHDLCEHGLAATRTTHDGDEFFVIDVEGHILHGGLQGLAGTKILADALSGKYNGFIRQHNRTSLDGRLQCGCSGYSSCSRGMPSCNGVQSGNPRSCS